MSLSARTKSLLENARREAEPTPEDLRRVRARLSASVASVAETPSVVAVPLAFLKVLGGLAVVAAVGYGVWQWSKRQPVSEGPPPVAAVATTPPAGSIACPPAPACPPPVEVAPTKPLQCPPVAPGACAQVTGSAAAKDRAVSSHTFSTPADAVGDQWDLELGLLSDARIALDTERALDALGAMQKHERLFPNSAFTEERLAIQVMATCLMGQRDAARPFFERLLLRDPETTYLPRVRSACGADFVQPTPETGDE